MEQRGKERRRAEKEEGSWCRRWGREGDDAWKAVDGKDRKEKSTKRKEGQEEPVLMEGGTGQGRRAGARGREGDGAERQLMERVADAEGAKETGVRGEEETVPKERSVPGLRRGGGAGAAGACEESRCQGRVGVEAKEEGWCRRVGTVGAKEESHVKGIGRRVGWVG